MWKRTLGVETSFINTDGAVHFAYLRDGGDFDIARYGWIGDYSDPQNFLFLVESDNKGFNYGKYNNPQFDDLMKNKAVNEIDLRKRAEFLAQAEQIFLKDLPWIPLMHYGTKHLISSKRGLSPETRVYPSRYLSLKQVSTAHRSGRSDMFGAARPCSKPWALSAAGARALWSPVELPSSPALLRRPPPDLGVPTLFVIVTISFFLIRVAPGGRSTSNGPSRRR